MKKIKSVDNYLTASYDGGKFKENYRIVNDNEFFKSISDWIITDKVESYLCLLIGDVDEIYLVDHLSKGSYDECVVLGCNGKPLIFSDEDQIRDHIEAMVTDSSLVKLRVIDDTFH